MNKLICILAHCDTEEKLKSLLRCIHDCKKSGIEILIASHTVIPENIQSLVDYVIYDSKNELKYFNVPQHFLYNVKYGSIFKKYSTFDHGYAVMSLMRDAANFSRSISKDACLYMSYDATIDDDTLFGVFFSSLYYRVDGIASSMYDGVFTFFPDTIGAALSYDTNMFCLKTDAAVSLFNTYSSKDAYYLANTNLLEEAIYTTTKRLNLKINELDRDVMMQKFSTTVSSKEFNKRIPGIEIEIYNGDDGNKYLVCISDSLRDTDYEITLNDIKYFVNFKISNICVAKVPTETSYNITVYESGNIIYYNTIMNDELWMYEVGSVVDVQFNGELPIVNITGVLPLEYHVEFFNENASLISQFNIPTNAWCTPDVRPVYTWIIKVTCADRLVFHKSYEQPADKLYNGKKFKYNAFMSKYYHLIEYSGQSRLNFYKHIIPELVKLNRPLKIVETGTMWSTLSENMGAFTYIMGDLIKNYTDGNLYTIDISQEHINLCKNTTHEFSDVIEYVLSDSVTYLKNLSDAEVASVDLFYFDSYDLNVTNPGPSAEHHLNELKAVYNRLSPNCYIVVDDNYLPNTSITWVWHNEHGEELSSEIVETGDNIIGKGKLIDEFLNSMGWIRHKELEIQNDNNVFLYKKSI